MLHLVSICTHLLPKEFICIAVPTHTHIHFLHEIQLMKVTMYIFVVAQRHSTYATFISTIETSLKQCYCLQQTVDRFKCAIRSTAFKIKNEGIIFLLFWFNEMYDQHAYNTMPKHYVLPEHYLYQA